MKHSFCGRVAFQSHVERRRLHAKRAGQIALSWTRCLPGGVRSRFLGMILSNFLFEVRLSPERTGISLPLNLRPLVPETSTESICSWFARYLAAPERTQMDRIRQLSFQNDSTISAHRFRRKWFRPTFR